MLKNISTLVTCVLYQVSRDLFAKPLNSKDLLASVKMYLAKTYAQFADSLRADPELLAISVANCEKCI
jgi:hypothetical protein